MLEVSLHRHKNNQSLQGQRTLSLLVENCGRVHRGRDLNKQHKGDWQTRCSSLLCLLLNHLSSVQANLAVCS